MILFFLIFIFSSTAYATNYDVEAVNCIVGESAGEGYSGMLAIAKSIRNRGKLDGVYGCYAKHTKYETKDSFDLAKISWAMSIEEKPKWEANSWGTKKDIRKNHLDQKCEFEAHIGHHYFYKC